MIKIDLEDTLKVHTASVDQMFQEVKFSRGKTVYIQNLNSDWILDQRERTAIKSMIGFKFVKFENVRFEMNFIHF